MVKNLAWSNNLLHPLNSQTLNSHILLVIHLFSKISATLYTRHALLIHINLDLIPEDTQGPSIL